MPMKVTGKDYFSAFRSRASSFFITGNSPEKLCMNRRCTAVSFVVPRPTRTLTTCAVPRVQTPPTSTSADRVSDLSMRITPLASVSRGMGGKGTSGGGGSALAGGRLGFGGGFRGMSFRVGRCGSARAAISRRTGFSFACGLEFGFAHSVMN